MADLVRRKREELGLEELRGTVAFLQYSQGGFTVGKIRGVDGEEKSFAGKLVVQVGDPVILKGSWDTHPKFGLQFTVKHCEFDGEMSEEGLAELLAKHPAAKGIGPKKAEAIALVYKGRFDQAIEEEPDEVARVAGVSREAIEGLRSVWLSSRESMRARLFLANLGMTPAAQSAVLQHYGRRGLSASSVKTLIESDPFSLAREVKGFGFTRADEIAEKVGLSKSHPTRIAAGIEYAVSKQLDDGHTWTPYPDVVSGANQLLHVDLEKVAVVLDAMPGPHPDAKGFYTDGLKAALEEDERLRSMHAYWQHHPRLVGRSTDKWGTLGLSMPDVYEKELAVGRKFYELGRSPWFSEEDAERIAREAEGEGLNLGQRRALWAALRFNLVTISGAAGVGKTFVMGKIADAYERAGAEVVLCAPTGKAAKRMEAASGRAAQTIHRLLGYRGRSFQRNTEWFGGEETLRAGLVIVDEVSMVDVLLMHELLLSVDLAKTTLVFLGDHHQLPPVGPGSVLRDVVERRPMPVIVLDEVVRQAGVLRQACGVLLKGEIHKSVWEKTEDGKLFAPWVVKDNFEKAADVGKYCLELAEKVLGEKLGFDPIEVQFLAPMYKGPAGVDALNRRLQRFYQKKRWGVEVEEVSPEERAKLYVNDRVIQTRNHYALDVMNGTQGFVRAVREDGGMDVEFDGRLVSLEKRDARDLELAYCLSVHKSQGDQWPCLVQVAHSAHSHMLTRNLVYTGVTRSQKTAILVGDRKGIQSAVQRVDAMKRRTWLSVLELPRCG